MSKKADSFEFAVDSSSDLPLWIQLKNRLIYLIETGYYRPGDQLPTVRGLAADISVNYNTVNKAYLGLSADGYIESSRGRGAFVLDVPLRSDGDRDNAANDLVNEFIQSCLSLGMGYDDIHSCVSRRISRLKYDEEHGGESHIIDLASNGQASVLKRKAGA